VRALHALYGSYAHDLIDSSDLNLMALKEQALNVTFLVLARKSSIADLLVNHAEMLT